jgi:hypothetical protein
VHVISVTATCPKSWLPPIIQRPIVNGHAISVDEDGSEAYSYSSNARVRILSEESRDLLIYPVDLFPCCPSTVILRNELTFPMTESGNN